MPYNRGRIYEVFRMAKLDRAWFAIFPSLKRPVGKRGPFKQREISTRECSGWCSSVGRAADL